MSSQVEIAKSELHDLTLLKYTDRTTRIPNESKFEEDLLKIGKKASSGKPYHLAMIDLLDFGNLNQKIGYSATDSIIRDVAQDIFRSMRRNEDIYKKAPPNADEDYFHERLYRKYSGGDEFLIIVEGPEFEVLGLLNRIAEKAGRYSTMAKSHGADWEFGFNAGICPIQRNDLSAEAKKRVEDCLAVARRKDHPNPYYWYSELAVDDETDDRWNDLATFAKAIYRKAAATKFSSKT